MTPPYEQKRVQDQSQLILSSYEHWLGAALISSRGPSLDVAKGLFEAPMVVVSHGLGPDPVLNYGNQRALDLWEMTWDSFIHTPSRLTAEIINRAERAKMLDLVSEQGYYKNYQGIRVTGTGKQFRIEGGMVWNLIDETGEYRGQAATFKDWTYL